MILEGFVTKIFAPIRGERKSDGSPYSFVPFEIETKETRFTRDGTQYVHTDTFVVNFNCSSNELHLNVGDKVSADVSFSVAGNGDKYFQKVFCKYVRVIG